jgi:hypothetical protein
MSWTRKFTSVVLVESPIGHIVQYRPDGRVLRGLSETLEPQESYIKAAVRGVREELGLNVTEADLTKIRNKRILRRKTLYWFYIYKCFINNPPASFPPVDDGVILKWEPDWKAVITEKALYDR